MIDAAVGALDLRLLEKPVGSQLDPPVLACALLGDRARRRGVESRTRRALRKYANESIRRAVGLESNARFCRLAWLEQTCLPPVGRIQFTPQHRGELRLPAAL